MSHSVVPGTVWNFGSVAIGSDLIFGAVVYSEDGWLPFSEIDDVGQEWIRKQVLANPLSRTLLDAVREAIFPAA